MFMAFANFGDGRLADYLVVEADRFLDARNILRNQGVDFDKKFYGGQEPVFSDIPCEYETKEDLLLNIDSSMSICFYIKSESTTPRTVSYCYYNES